MSRISPLEFEKKFEKGIQNCNDTPWTNLKLFILADLLYLIQKTLPKKQRESYLLELFHYLKDSLNKFADSNKLEPNIDPGLMEILVINFNQISKTIYSNPFEDDLLTQNLVAMVCRLYLNLNAFDKIVDLLMKFRYIRDSHRKWDSSNHKNIQNKKDNFYQFLSGDLSIEIFSLIFTNHDKREFQSSVNTINCLFVVNQNEYKVGIIADLSLTDLSIKKKEGVDRVRISTHLVDENDSLADQTQAMCRYIHKKFIKDKDRQLQIEYSINQPSSILSGNSIGLSLTLLSHNATQMYRKNTIFQPRIYSDVVFTGALDEYGIVQPVDGRNLCNKLDAAFFGVVTSVVVPDSQYGVAINRITELNHTYPDRELKIIPIKTLEEILSHREILFLQRRQITHRVGQFIKDYANSVTYGILGFMVICVALFYFEVVKHPVPDHIIIELGDLKIRNKYGFNLWGINSFTNPSSTDSNNRILIKKNTKIIDLNRDGEIEVLIGFDFDSTPEMQGLLICFDAENNEKWRYRIGKKTSFGDNKYTANFAVSTILVNDLNFNDQYEIIVSGFNKFFPYHLSVLDSKGREISNYWHSGYLLYFRIVDILSSNSTKELLITGINNEYKSGVMMLIDPFLMMGTSPQEQYYYKMQPNIPGNEIYYIRFPTTHFQNKYYTDTAAILGIDNNNIEMLLSSTNNLIDEGGDLESIFYTFDNDFKVNFTELADVYYINYEKMYADHPPLPYNDKETINYFKSVDYWDGDKWVKVPTMNRRYLESLVSD